MGRDPVRPVAARAPWLCLLLAISTFAQPPPSTFEAARALLENGELGPARAAFEAAAGQGDMRAQAMVARMYLDGIGGAADTQAAMGWYCALAHQPRGGREVALAVWFLAEYYRTGGGLPVKRYRGRRREREDPVRAYFWFRVLAEQQRFYAHVVEAAAKLGRMGRGALSDQLLEQERELVEQRLDRWSPARPPSSHGACLALPRQ